MIAGGLAHGIGCPPRALGLAREHRLRTIRATPAGAIAAALTAAAEYGRESAGYSRLAALNDWLVSGTDLDELLPPARETRPVRQLFLSLRRRGRNAHAASGIAALAAKFWGVFPEWVRIAFEVVPGALRDALPAHYWIATVLGGIAGGALDVLIANALVDASHPQLRTLVAFVLPVMFVGCWVASFGVCTCRLWQLLSRDAMRRGGIEAQAPAKTPAFDAWLHRSLQDLAGLAETAPPLTLGMLRAKRAGAGTASVGIELQLDSTGVGADSPADMPVLVAARSYANVPFFLGPVSTHMPSAMSTAITEASGAAPERISARQFLAAIWATPGKYTGRGNTEGKENGGGTRIRTGE